MRLLEIAEKTFRSRLFLGTGKFGTPETMQKAIVASETEMVTVALKRTQIKRKESDTILKYIDRSKIQLLPNTSGAKNASEAVFASQLAREALETHWIKLEIHPDPKYLMPDPVETLKAAEELVKLGFIVLPYVHADPVLCKRLEEVGTSAVMPLASPIGSNMGISVKRMLEIIIEQSAIPVIVDAGLGQPSHAAEAMEMGADAVLINTAIAISGNPERMATAFKNATEAGRAAFEVSQTDISKQARASSPLTAFLE